MAPRCRRQVLAALLGVSVLALAVSILIVEVMPEMLWASSLSTPFYLLSFTCVFGVTVARSFLRREWWVCLLSGTILGIIPLLLALADIIVERELGRRSTIIMKIFNQVGDPLFEPSMQILSLLGVQTDIYSSHISAKFLFNSWVVLTVCSVVFWSLVFALGWRFFIGVRRRILRFRGS